MAELSDSRDEAEWWASLTGTAYLQAVVDDLESTASEAGSFRAEQLFWLNEAAFNLSDDDLKGMGEGMVHDLFQTLKKIQQAYETGQYDDSDQNFFFDYVALLSTMQNQPCFCQQDTATMLTWLSECTRNHGLDHNGAPGVEAEDASGGTGPSYVLEILEWLDSSEAKQPGSLRAEQLCRLNGVVFNLTEEDLPDAALVSKLYEMLERIHHAYQSGKYCDADGNFFFDYVAVLGTMQNQHFLTLGQTAKILDWIAECTKSADDICLEKLAELGSTSSGSASED